MNAPTFPELSERLGKLDPNAKALWGKMNLAQMLVHCRIPMETGLGLREVEKPSANFATRWLLFPLLMNLPWPKGKAQTHPEFNVVKADLPVRSVAEEASDLAGKMKTFMEGNFKPRKHAIFGELSLSQWADLQRKHLDHHFRQFGF